MNLGTQLKKVLFTSTLLTAMAVSTPSFAQRNYSYNENYSVRVAEQHPDFEKDVSVLRNKIQLKLSFRQHIDRINAPYKEDYSQLDSIDDKVILSLVDQNIAMLDNFSYFDFNKFFLNMYSDEEGGFIQYDSLMKFQPLENQLEKSQRGDHYGNSALSALSHLGVFHTHSRNVSDSEITDSYLMKHPYAGPSYPTKLSVKRNTPDDLSTFIKSVSKNRYFLDMVITEVRRSLYNVDLYFLNQDFENKLGLVVIDAGVWDFRVKK